MFYELDRRFVQQSARVGTVARAYDEAYVVSFELLDEPVSAENRQVYRVTTTINAPVVKLDEEADCQVKDVSPVGFSVIAEERHDIGKFVPTTVCFEGREFSGTVCIQSARELGQGQIRYGLRVIRSRTGSDNLAKGMTQISMAIQREKLRHLAGTT